jgi:hypothetical protein
MLGVNAAKRWLLAEAYFVLQSVKNIDLIFNV